MINYNMTLFITIYARVCVCLGVSAQDYVFEETYKRRRISIIVSFGVNGRN